MLRFLCLILMILFFNSHSYSQTVNVGSGSYTTAFPGVDIAGRNTFPSGSPITTGPAASKPAPTNDWWSNKIKNAHSDNLFSYPYTLKTVNEGLVVTYIPWGVIDIAQPVIVGVSGLNSPQAKVYDHTDWTMTMDWTSSTHNFKTTTGIGMPFLYFEKNTSDVARVVVNQGSVTVSNELLIITNAHNGADFVVYAPSGSVWNQSGNTYTSTLNGNNYWSMAFLPLSGGNVTTMANEYKQFAYVFPANTTAEWNYNESTSVVRTDFKIDVDIKEGSDTTMLLGLLPHQWSNLAPGAPAFEYSYPTVRGELKTVAANTFTVENTFSGILPTLPYVDFYSPGFNPGSLSAKVNQLENDALNPWTDSYNEGQEMNRLIQTARIADLIGDTAALSKLLNTIQTRLEDWLSFNSGEVAFLFYYNQTWDALIGYPAGHGQDGNINDHHFHWGYFIHAASFVEQFNPGWVNQWGPMVELLIRDAASMNRQDNLFPFLRNFSPYAGHCWANGFATFPQGNDQESTSESMQFNSSLIHWGSITGNDSIRDLGIYLYTTEQTAIEEYWLDIHNRNFGPTQQYSLVSRVWGNSYDNGTFWTSDIEASYGIELYPIHGGSLYLGHDTNYVNQLWTEITQNTGILNNDPNVNLWHDVMWEYLAFIDPQAAISLYDSYPNRTLKFGVSDAQTYHWLHSMNALGRVEASITADHPLAVAFYKNGSKVYVAHNYSNTPIDVNFSDGYVLSVPAKDMATSLDLSISGTLSTNFDQAYVGGSVNLDLQVSGTPTKVVFLDGADSLGESTTPPFTFKADNLTAGRHNFHAQIYIGFEFAESNFVEVIVGEQLPYHGVPAVIPGSLQAGDYDYFEGGNASSISYLDNSITNEGDYRVSEYVDAFIDGNEGASVGWIAGGEWLEYTVDVQQAGFYTLNMRYACGNGAGGGPMNIESDGQLVKSGISVGSTGSWSSWNTQQINNVPLKSGEQIIRLYFTNGELNIASLNFVYASALSYSQPIANAGVNQIVVLPQTSVMLDGSGSINPGGGSLSYQWTQVYGPEVLQFSNDTSAQPTITGLDEGVYLLKLAVNNGSYSDEDLIYVISSYTNNVAPKVSLLSPLNNEEYYEDEAIQISATASDLNDSVSMVSFLANDSIFTILTSPPYTLSWTPAPGNYDIKAIAYDSNGDSAVSNVVAITVVNAPPCYGTSWDGDFDYEFSPADDNPTLTFIPSGPGVGDPTCILYYGTSTGSLPGYYVTPNVPYTLNASMGSTIYFYYTYSFPGVVEKNNSANKDSYVIGSCKCEAPELSFTVTDVSSSGGSDGAIDLSVINGSPPYTYNWSDGSTTEDLSGLTTGFYSVTVTDSEFCTESGIISVDEPLSCSSQPAITNLS
ncbi:MAG: carbohydrate-binding protein, partial [Chitinophagales bacterium]|nr:carbohydrate-binding protein [Chitinophagales bacterium]